MGKEVASITRYLDHMSKEEYVASSFCNAPSVTEETTVTEKMTVTIGDQENDEATGVETKKAPRT